MIGWLKEYRRDWVRPDVIAGLTTAAFVIPKAMAYATIAGLPVQVGLYTAFVPMLIYALTGSSRPLSVSTSTTIAILMGAQLSLLVPDGDAGALQRVAATLALMVGAILVLAAMVRLGFVANFISEPVLIGFKAGIGVVIVVDQIPKLLGIHFSKGPFFGNLLSIVKGIPETSVPTLCVALAMIVLLITLEHWTPQAPAPLIAVAAGIGGMSLLGLSSLGVEAVGHIPRGLPSLTFPDVSLIETLWPGAAGIALMSFTETIAAGRAFAQSGEPAPRPNRELLATGLANAGGALLGAPVIALMPQATLAAVVIVYSIGLIRPAEFLAIRRIRRMEFRWAVIAFAGVMLLGTLKGILVAIVVSLVGLVYTAGTPEVHVLGRKRGTNVFRPVSAEHSDDETFPGLLMLRLQGTVFFANVGTLADKLRPPIERANPKVVAIDFSGVPDLEYTALKLLIEAEARERERGVSIWLVALTPKMLEMVQRSPLGATLGREGLHFNMETAVAHYLER
ncbi:MAG: sulfate transporter [Deltaproteobacteria bacterium]|nr:sulfate transporter [Deltaproteobacteria bacterium]